MNSPDSGVPWTGGRINNPTSIASHRRIFGSEPFTRHLPRVGPIGIRNVDLQVARAIRAPEEILTIRREAGVPVVGGMIGQAAFHSGLSRDRPDFQVATSVRGENDFVA